MTYGYDSYFSLFSVVLFFYSRTINWQTLKYFVFILLSIHKSPKNTMMENLFKKISSIKLFAHLFESFIYHFWNYNIKSTLCLQSILVVQTVYYTYLWNESNQYLFTSKIGVGTLWFFRILFFFIFHILLFYQQHHWQVQKSPN